MSKPQKAGTPPAAEEAKPLVLVGLEQTPKGYVPVSVVIRGDRVVSKETHGAPQLKQFSAAILRRVLSQKVLFPNGR